MLDAGFREAIVRIVGTNGYSDDIALRELYSHDIWSKGATAEFVVAPASTMELSGVVAAAAAREIPLFPRGGGMSYTNGYLSSTPGGGVVDFSRLSRIVEVNAADMYVTVEAGCTWDTLNSALAGQGLRTPFWGPLSGISSTIGGGLSQNNAFFGAGVHGPTSDSVISLAIVTGEGDIIRTGTAGADGGRPFWRHYGPDLAGLFLGDAGALGFKAEATLRLVPAPSHEDWASFEFKGRDACADATAAVARQNVACEVFAFDPNLQRVRMKRASLAADAKSLANVVRKQGSVFGGLKEGAKIALAGRSFMANAAYSLHFVVEGPSNAGVRENIACLKRICETHGGREIENSIPKIIRANPFTPLNNMLGPSGERWTPVHGIVPLSQGSATWREIDDLFDSMQQTFDRHDILTGYLVTTLSTNGYLVEPVFIWPEEIFPVHEASVERSWLDRLPRHPANPEATAVVAEARRAVIDVFKRRGGAHFQIGRTYPFFETRSPEARALLMTLKQALDPKGIVNPGALGLAGTNARLTGARSLTPTDKEDAP
ncbi:MAG: FAD-binding protein [Alphaproteobacteria bacterium]|nr:FAD-binding protein [Alphaproteobacteria bacterium]